MYTPKNPRVPETPTKKLKLLTALSFGAFFVLSIAAMVLSLQVVTKNNALQSKQSDIDVLAATLEKSTSELTKAKRALLAQNALPALDSFSAQCPGGNKEDGIFMPLSETPIEGYNVILLECRSSISAGKSDPRILVFRVNSDGSKEFTYGASKTEPLCVSNLVPVANKIAAKLNIPVCGTN